MNTASRQRLSAMRALLSAQRLSGLLVTQPANWYYLTGFSGEAGALILTQRGAILVSDGRFTSQAKQETSGIRVATQKGSLTATVGELLKAQGRLRIGFDATQLTVAQLRALKAAAGKRVQWITASGLLEGLRARKEPQEIAQMRKAGALASQVVTAAFKLLKPGVRELEIAAEIEYQMRQRGASGPAFETIVAFGERSAYPHARPTAKRLRKNELVVLDLGAILGHYCSDITRTVVVGRASTKIRQWHKAVQQAQAAAVGAVQAGASCGEVDGAARNVLAGHRLDRYFVHSTGHGLGLEVHEDPRVAKGQKYI